MTLLGLGALSASSSRGRFFGVRAAGLAQFQNRSS